MPLPRLFKSQQSRLYYAVVLLTVLVSIAGVLRATLLAKTERGGQGGAIGVALAFWIIFLNRNLGERLYKSILAGNSSLSEKLELLADKKPMADFTNAELTTAMTATMARFSVESEEQRDQNKALVWASVLGTIFWGFGDRFADYLITPMAILHHFVHRLAA